MARKKIPDKEPDSDLGKLDDLISCCYAKLLRGFDKNAKLGDFLKMIEMRQKLAPGKTAQDEFWKMLQRIRTETLSGKKPAAKAGAPDPSVRKRKG